MSLVKGLRNPCIGGHLLDNAFILLRFLLVLREGSMYALFEVLDFKGSFRCCLG